MLHLRIHLFARARELAGVAHLEMSVALGTTVGELRHCLTQTAPALASILDRCAIAINQEFADDALVLAYDAEVAVIPPVSGGASPSTRRKRSPRPPAEDNT